MQVTVSSWLHGATAQFMPWESEDGVVRRACLRVCCGQGEITFTSGWGDGTDHPQALSVDQLSRIAAIFNEKAQHDAHVQDFHAARAWNASNGQIVAYHAIP